jgi:hypothetical protein
MPGTSTCAVCGKAGKAVAFKEETMDKVCFRFRFRFVDSLFFDLDLIWFVLFGSGSIQLLLQMISRTLSLTHAHTTMLYLFVICLILLKDP